MTISAWHGWRLPSKVPSPKTSGDQRPLFPPSVECKAFQAQLNDRKGGRPPTPSTSGGVGGHSECSRETPEWFLVRTIGRMS